MIPLPFHNKTKGLKASYVDLWQQDFYPPPRKTNENYKNKKIWIDVFMLYGRITPKGW